MTHEFIEDAEDAMAVLLREGQHLKRRRDRGISDCGISQDHNLKMIARLQEEIDSLF